MLNRNYPPLQVAIQGQPINTTIINTMADFPAPVAGVITLEADTLYDIRGVGLSTSDRFYCDGNLIMSGLGSFPNLQLTYTGSGNMFTVEDGFIRFSDIMVTAPSGTVLNASLTGAPALGLVLVRAINFVIYECQKVFDLTDYGITMTDCAVLSSVDGISFALSEVASISTLSLRQFAFAGMQNGCTAIDLGDVVVGNIFELTDVGFNQIAGTGTSVSGLANSGNLTSGLVGRISGCEFGANTSMNNLSVDDFQYVFMGNSGLRDTHSHIQTYMDGNSTYTTVGAASTPYKVVGTFFQDHGSQFLLGHDGGSQRLRYRGIIPKSFRINITFIAYSASGSPNVTFVLYRNSVATEGKSTVDLQGSLLGQSGALSWIVHELGEDDYLELYVINNDNTVNILVSDASFGVTT